MRQRLQDISDFDEELREALQGFDFARFRADRTKQRVAERLLEIAGEAATHVPDEVAAGIEGDWERLRRMRILLAHAYQRIEVDQLWLAATVALPRFASAVRQALDAA